MITINSEFEFDVGSDLTITEMRERESAEGTWVGGTLNGHRFEALVFRDHAEDASYELGRSRISKLWLRRQRDRTVVANFDRGWDLRPTTDLATAIVDFLAAGLAEHVYSAK